MISLGCKNSRTGDINSVIIMYKRIKISSQTLKSTGGYIVIVPRSTKSSSKFFVRQAIIQGAVAKIPLGIEAKDGYAIVDTEDLDKISGVNWTFTHGYAVNGSGGKRTYLHRVISSAGETDIVDHINRDKLDNRKTNLRLTDRINNTINKVYKNKYGYRGVSQNKKRYSASISYRNIKYDLGTYDTPLEAAQVYNMKARELHGEFAVLNEIPHEKNT